jgi:hypothetical protein
VLLGSRGGRVRCLAVWTVATAALGAAGAVMASRLPHLPPTLAAPARTPLDVALTDLAAAALLVCAGWLWVVTTAVVVEAVRGADTPGRAPRGVPAGVRRVVLAACGVALVNGLAQPSQAAGPHTRAHHHGPLAALSGLPLPDRAVATAPPSRAGQSRTVRVRAGDSLWSLAAGDLPADSSDALVATRWRAIYAANRSVIGPDPDVIVPGQRLVLPGKDPS